MRRAALSGFSAGLIKISVQRIEIYLAVDWAIRDDALFHTGASIDIEAQCPAAVQRDLHSHDIPHTAHANAVALQIAGLNYADDVIYTGFIRNLRSLSGRT